MVNKNNELYKIPIHENYLGFGTNFKYIPRINEDAIKLTRGRNSEFITLRKIQFLKMRRRCLSIMCSKTTSESFIPQHDANFEVKGKLVFGYGYTKKDNKLKSAKKSRRINITQRSVERFKTFQKVI